VTIALHRGRTPVPAVTTGSDDHPAPGGRPAARQWRSPRLASTISSIEGELDQAWEGLLRDFGIPAGSPDEAALARLVVDNPAEYEWRVVDAALDRVTCPECGAGLPKGPASCQSCAYYNGMRFGAREIDRPNVPAGNEHAIRVAAAVARTRHRYSPRARVGYELALPDLVAGSLPTTAQAQAAKALINKLTPEECDRVTSFADVEALARDR
jgi:ribosomal protein L40E